MTERFLLAGAGLAPAACGGGETAGGFAFARRRSGMLRRAGETAPLDVWLNDGTGGVGGVRHLARD